MTIYRTRPCSHCNGSGVAHERVWPTLWTRIRARLRAITNAPLLGGIEVTWTPPLPDVQRLPTPPPGGTGAMPPHNPG
jgi:hypothetical protein